MTMSISFERGQAPLPVFGISLGAFGLNFQDLKVYFSAARMPVLYFLGFTTLLAGVAFFLDLGILGNLLEIASLFFLVPAATSWIRLTATGLSGSPEWRFGAEEKRYLVTYIQVMTMIAAVGLGGLLVLSLLNTVLPSLGVIAAFAVIAGLFYVNGRMLPALGAAATGQDIRLTDSWQAAGPFTPRLGAATLIFNVALVIVLFCIFILAAGPYLALSGIDISRISRADGGNIEAAVLETLGIRLIFLNILMNVIAVLVVLYTSVFYGRIWNYLTS